MIYKPTNAAYEYCDLALNHYKSCTHGCSYCYGAGALRKTKENYFEHLDIKKDVLKKLPKDAAKHKGQTVHLSFIGDVYQPIEKELEITKEVLNIFADNEIRPQILTKAGVWGLERDLEILQRTNARYGVTLTFDDDAESKQWEPGAALPIERINALKLAKELGLATWVSFEPVINPKATIRLIEQVAEFTDFMAIGKLNKHPLANSIDWISFYNDVLEVMQSVNVEYYIKDDLRKEIKYAQKK